MFGIKDLTFVSQYFYLFYGKRPRMGRNITVEVGEKFKDGSLNTF